MCIKTKGGFPIDAVIFILILCVFFAAPFIAKGLVCIISPGQIERNKIHSDEILLARCILQYEEDTGTEFSGDFSKIKTRRNRSNSALRFLLIDQEQDWNSEGNVPLNPYGNPYYIIGSKAENNRQIISETEDGETISFPVDYPAS